MNQDLETGIQKLKELKQYNFENSDEHDEIVEIVKLLTQAKDYQEKKNKRSIVWSVEDFIYRAEQIKGTYWQDIYDKSKFEKQLYEMIDAHDANYGITWESVDYYLDECCLKK